VKVFLILSSVFIMAGTVCAWHYWNMAWYLAIPLFLVAFFIFFFASFIIIAIEIDRAGKN